MNSYSLTYTFDRKKPLKTALLALALGVDFVNIAFFVSAVCGDYIKFAYLAAGIVAMLALRLPTLKMTYGIKYVFKDGLAVYRVYPHKQELIFCLSGDFSLKEINKERGETPPDNVLKLYVYEQDTPVYVVSCGDKSYALALDDYMLALILSFYGKKLN